MNNDIEIIKQAILKDSSAFVKAADGVKAKLYNTAYVILGTEADACDAVDEAMYYAWINIHKLREARLFYTWITRILINQCNKILKRRKKEVLYESMPELTCEVFDALPIQEAILKLPNELKTIIGLRYFSDMTVPEMANMLRIPQGTIKTRQRKALALLRLELE